MAKKVTMQQIADYLGVSKYVVSVALSGKKGVSEETRKKVLSTAAKLGYIPSPAGPLDDSAQHSDAASKPKREHLFLVIMQNVHVQTRESPYWGEIIDGIQSTIEKHGCKMVLLTEIYTENLGKIVNLREFSGVITVGYVSSDILLEVKASGLPLVMVDHEDLLVPSDTIFSNNFDACFQLTNYLYGMGHRRIQFVGDIEYARSFYERYNGVRNCLKDKGLEPPYSEELLHIKGETFYEQFHAWMSQQTEETFPTAFVCANDQIASTVISILTEAGYRIPDDISVTGFDNTTLSYTASPTITTVDVAKKEMGKRSVEVLMRRMCEKDAALEKIILMSNIIYRESTGRAK